MNDVVHSVCPHCHATNRVPAARMHAAARCGKCKQPLFDGHPVELTQADFSKHVQHSDIPVVVDFWAPWCGPCRIMAPIFEKAAAQLAPRAQLAKLNTESEQAVAAQYGIRSIPTLIVFKQGREIARQAGAMDLGSLTRWISAYI